jgi:hypothetical protein
MRRAQVSHEDSDEQWGASGRTVSLDHVVKIKVAWPRLPALDRSRRQFDDSLCGPYFPTPFLDRHPIGHAAWQNTANDAQEE